MKSNWAIVSASKLDKNVKAGVLKESRYMWDD